jgi:hypothetical protein
MQPVSAPHSSHGVILLFESRPLMLSSVVLWGNYQTNLALSSIINKLLWKSLHKKAASKPGAAFCFIFLAHWKQATCRNEPFRGTDRSGRQTRLFHAAGQYF